MKRKTHKAIVILTLGFSGLFGNSVFAQTCENCGIGTTSPTSRLHIKGCTMGSGTSSLNVTDSNSNSIFYIQDDGKVGLKTTSPGRTFDGRGSFVLSDADISSNNYFGNSGDNAIIGYTGNQSALSVINTNTGLTNSVLEIGSLRSSSSAFYLMRVWNGNGTTATGTNLLFNVRGDGHVGIGTSTPLGIFHTIASGAKTASYSGNLLTNTATSSTASITKTGLEITSTGTWNGTSARNIGLYVSSVSGGTNNYDAIFNGGGNVGIGTAFPSSLLHLTSSGSTIMKFDRSGASTFGLEISGTGFGLYNHTATKYVWRANSGDLYLQETSGNVGVGTTTPSEKLTINGNFLQDYGSTRVTNTLKSSNTLGPEYRLWNTGTNGVEYRIGSSGTGNTGGAGNFFIYDAAATSMRLIINSTGKVGVGTTSPNSLLHVAGSSGFKVSTVTSSSYTAGGETVILADANSAAITINLPAASGVTDRIYCIKKTDASANTVTIDGNASETIDGATTKVLSSQYDAVTIVCNGSNWFIID